MTTSPAISNTGGTGIGTGATASGSASVSDTYQTFLKLLTSQIQNQDPLSPMDTTQWTNQLVQYNSVEQQLKTNSLLSSLLTQGQSGGLGTGVAFIGKTVSANTDTVTLSQGQANWNFNLGKDANTAAVNVFDSKGNLVFTKSLGPTASGDHSFSWDGSQTSGGKLTSGDYTLKVVAQDTQSNTIATNISMSGIVKSVFENNGIAYLRVGGTAVPLSGVTSVE